MTSPSFKRICIIRVGSIYIYFFFDYGILILYPYVICWTGRGFIIFCFSARIQSPRLFSNAHLVQWPSIGQPGAGVGHTRKSNTPAAAQDIHQGETYVSIYVYVFSCLEKTSVALLLIRNLRNNACPKRNVCKYVCHVQFSTLSMARRLLSNITGV